MTHESDLLDRIDGFIEAHNAGKHVDGADVQFFPVQPYFDYGMATSIFYEDGYTVIIVDVESEVENE